MRTALRRLLGVIAVLFAGGAAPDALSQHGATEPPRERPKTSEEYFQTAEQSSVYMYDGEIGPLTR